MAQLPFCFPPIETYQAHSFVLGVLLAYPEYSEIQYRNYINLRCQKTGHLSSIDLAFESVLWDEYYEQGLVEKNVYDMANFNKKTLIRFLKERIDEGYYPLLYDLDEYYLSYTDVYKIFHSNHDTYIYGYEGNCFLVEAYKGDHLSLLTVKQEELANALLSKKAYKDVDKKRSFAVFRPWPYGKVKAESQEMLCGIRKFYEKTEPVADETGTVYGFGVYKVLLEYAKNLDVDKNANLRPFRCVWEHKKLMVRRIEYMYPDAKDGRLEMMREICDEMELVFRIMMKYNRLLKREILERACWKFQAVIDKDMQWYKKYIQQEGAEKG
ncbi:MAG: hypothetical protein J5898_11190 [Lachnospiraceae bacterium]|nr:hypothetical protein [Lachnospiraceae bacterium]